MKRKSQSAVLDEWAASCGSLDPAAKEQIRARIHAAVTLPTVPRKHAVRRMIPVAWMMCALFFGTAVMTLTADRKPRAPFLFFTFDSGGAEIQRRYSRFPQLIWRGCTYAYVPECVPEAALAQMLGTTVLHPVGSDAPDGVQVAVASIRGVPDGIAVRMTGTTEWVLYRERSAPDTQARATDASSDIQALIDRIYQCDTGFPNDMTSEEVSRLLNDGGESARKTLRFAAAHSQPVPNPMDGMMAPSSDAEALHDDRKSTSQTESKVCYNFRTGETTIEVNGEKRNGSEG